MYRQKSNKILIFVLSTLLLLGAIFITVKTFSNNYEIINSDKLSKKSGKAKTIVAFGDSLIVGVGASKGNDFISLLSKEIGQPILNLGKSGDTTVSALNRIDFAIKTNPDIVIVLLGGNDYLKKVPQEETFKNLSKIIKTFQDNGSVVILLGVRGGLLKDNFAASFEKTAKTNGAIFVPNVLDNILGEDKLMSDAIHPNDAGYKIISEKVLPELNKLLK